MPNWIEGTLKIRSKDINNIKNFLKEAVGYTCHACPLSQEEKGKCQELMFSKDKKPLPCDSFRPYDKNIKVDSFDDGSSEVLLKDLLLIKDGPSRAYIGHEDDETYEYIDIESPILILPMKEAWGFDSEGWLELAKKYNVDIRLYGIEQGMQFAQEIEIVNGKVTLEREITYDDWDWECPFPRMGG